MDRSASIRTPLKQMLVERSMYRKLLFTSEIRIYILKTLHRTLRAVGVRERSEALQACILLLISHTCILLLI
jgi:hypothetical protein